MFFIFPAADFVFEFEVIFSDNILENLLLHRFFSEKLRANDSSMKSKNGVFFIATTNDFLNEMRLVNVC